MTDTEYLEQFNAEYWETLEREGVSELSRLQQDALCIMSFQGEINNGGIHQYLLNSSGDLAQETPDVLRRIGADAVAAILERANAYFRPGGPPTEREVRMEMLLAMSEHKQQEIHDLTDDFYDYEDRGGCLADLFDAYVLSHRPMANPISVNDAIDRLAELAGRTVKIFGSLSLEFEGTCINHIPKSERRGDDTGTYQSSIWVNFVLAVINQREQWLEQFDGRHVRVAGTLVAPLDGYDGCGHFSMWPAELNVTSIDKLTPTDTGG